MSLSVDVRARRGSFTLEVAFEAKAGETVAVLGPNGSGKSTLVSVIAGLLAPEWGTITAGGATLDDASKGIHVVPGKRPIGVDFQELLLMPHITAADNIAFPLRARGTPKGPALRAATDLLRRLGAEEVATRLPGELSGGEAQRIGLARALIARPAVLLLDEPMSALDATARQEIRSLLAETLSTVDAVRILTTHDPVDALTLATRIVLLEDGRVTQQGTPGEIRDAPRTRYAADLVGLNLFAGELTPLDAGVARIETGEGDVIASTAGIPASHGRVLALLRPADVTVHASEPDSSARNVLSGTVASIALEGERARVRIDTAPPLVAEITLGSVTRLGIRPGLRVWASFKAVEVRLVPADAA